MSIREVLGINDNSLQELNIRLKQQLDIQLEDQEIQQQRNASPGIHGSQPKGTRMTHHSHKKTY